MDLLARFAKIFFHLNVIVLPYKIPSDVSLLRRFDRISRIVQPEYFIRCVVANSRGAFHTERVYSECFLKFSKVKQRYMELR